MNAPATSPPQDPGRRVHQRMGGVVVPHAPRWHQRLGAWCVFVFVRTITATLRYRWFDSSGQLGTTTKGPVIYAVWHNRLGLSMTAYYGYATKRNPTSGMAALVSASKDGGLLAAILECFRVEPVRGSTSRRGPQALLELTTWAERGYDLAITPDGPRGPRCQVQEGVIYLAQVTGLPIIPFSCRIPWKVCARSWDRFQIPLPFSRCEMHVGEPLVVPREATEAEREKLRSELERTLLELSGD